MFSYMLTHKGRPIQPTSPPSGPPDSSASSSLRKRKHSSLPETPTALPLETGSSAEEWFTPEAHPVPPTKRKMRRDECQSCCEDVPANQFPKKPHKTASTSCRACLSCWSQYLHSQLERLEWNELSCVGCGAVLEMNEIMAIQTRFKDKDKIEPKIQEKATMSLLRAQSDFVSCPSSTCKDGATMTDGNLFTCRTCEYRYCFHCNVPFHEGERCQEFQDRIKKDERKTLEIAQSLEMLGKTTKPCPKCKSPIEKRSGCDHMSCTKCKHQFCWLCFVSWRAVMRTGNHEHEKECKYYRAWNTPPPNANVARVQFATEQDLRRRA